MALIVLDKPAGELLQTTHFGGSLSGIGGLAELMRAELFSHSTAMRRTLVRNVGQLAAATVELPAVELERLCSHLESLGDFLPIPGGRLAAAPLRCVDLGTGRAMVLAGAPSRVIEASVGGPVATDGLRRHVPWSADVEARCRSLGAGVLGANQWARLEGAPAADDLYLASLDAGLTAAQQADLHRPSAELEWLGWANRAGAMVWQLRAPSARLWRATSAWGRSTYAWTEGNCPSSSALELSREQAVRAQYALAMAAGLPAVLTVQQSGSDCALRLPWWLPAPEYRWLTLYAVSVHSAELGWHWRTSIKDWPKIAQTLRTQLGVLQGGNPL